jgi:hypothetical protein
MPGTGRTGGSRADGSDQGERLARISRGVAVAGVPDGTPSQNPGLASVPHHRAGFPGERADGSAPGG